MTGRQRGIGIVIIAACAGVALAVGGLYAAGGRINTSKSLALGLYWVTDAPVVKGAYVMVCPPDTRDFVEARQRGYIDAGFCPGNFGHLMKKILAAKGDLVSLVKDGVSVNGVVLPYSKAFPADGLGRNLPHMSSQPYTLGEAEILLMSDVSTTSFDGRYFGPISRGQVTSVIKPVITWKGE
ncbi:conjugative transfer signal peptidase TraF [Pseudomonas syringae]|uniref:conjugative transfer signal peptidase TraF n=1 Tax=Pseudomonas syringae TaxID=317 RepID=UPI0002099177|nr:conjugative transfer signal peptidase TraF [Pseudomonas syringae]MDP5168558.1 conjugative transfer signal peptidase TraF [Pseudomonas syringae pv. aptata str. DSM 50252]